MRRAVSALIDLAGGIPFVLIAFFSARVLLQSRPLVYVCFPLLCTVALLAGFWRGRAGSLPVPLTAVLVSAPLFVVASQFFSGRNRPFILSPFLVLVFVAAGAGISRMRAKPSIAAAIVVVTNVAAVFAGPVFVRSIVRSRMVNETPVPFAIHLVDGRTISSRDLRGRVVVLDFWATWCVPCQHELPILQRVYDRSKDHVAFFAIDGVMTDTPGDAGDTAERAVAYFQRGRYTIPLAWDGGGVLEKAFSPAGFPTLLLLDRGGHVRMRHTGFMGGEDLEGDLLREIDEIRE